MSAIDRANRDIDEGNHWLARQRLESHLSTAGYDPELLAKLGEIASAMHDAFNAGRFWLTATAEGAHVDAAIAVFMAHAGSDPKQVAAELHRATRLSTLDSYPPVVQARLQRLGLDMAVVASSPSTPRAKTRMPWGTRVVVIVIAGIVLFCCISCGIGTYYLIRRLTGGGPLL